MNEHKTLIKNGLWDNNPALVQLLGLCPLLAVSYGTNALGLGIATLLVWSVQIWLSLCKRLCTERSSNSGICHDHCRTCNLCSKPNECIRIRTFFSRSVYLFHLS